MTEPSQLSRFRPAVLAITGIAAACSIYALYTVYSDKPPRNAPLRRSNAVHRTRPARQPSAMRVSHTHPYELSPLGRLIIRAGPEEHSIDLALERGLTDQEIQRRIGDCPESFRAEIRELAVICLIVACFLTRKEEERVRLDEMSPGLARLSTVLAVRNVIAIREEAFQPVLTALPAVTEQEFKNGLESFLAGATFNSDELSVSDDNLTIQETNDSDDWDERRGPSEPTQGLKALLYHIAEADATRKAYEHRGIHCDECGETPIRGIRWHCMLCPSWDLCSTCEASTQHPQTHVFVKIKIPIPVLSQPTRGQQIFYPGHPMALHDSLDKETKTRLQEAYDYEPAQIDALHDQFCCIANVEGQVDRSKVEFAIDRTAFNKALTSEQWSSRLRLNGIYDRMFAFYDTDSNGLIGFEEFVSGMAYLRGPNRFHSLRRALQGYDIDGDEHVDRWDFIRLFRAKFEVHKLLIEDMVKAQEIEQSHQAMETLRSSQPISSIFQEDIPPGEMRIPAGKTMDRFGDMQPDRGTKTILEDDDSWPGEDERRRRPKSNLEPHERLQGHLSRFEEMLGSSTEGLDGQQDEEVQNIIILDGDGANRHASGLTQTADAPALSGSGTANGTTTSIRGSVSGSSHIEDDDDVDDDDDNPIDQDILWRIREEGYHELLNPFFGLREDLEHNAIKTREYRKRWRKEIEEAALEKDKVLQELQSGADADPLMASALTSFLNPPLLASQEDARQPLAPSRAEMVPTDVESLARREAEIVQRPLDDLLNSTGYTIVEEVEESPELSGDRTDTLGEPRIHIGWVAQGNEGSINGHPTPPQPNRGTQPIASAEEIYFDPTMPQHRPNSSDPEVTSTQKDELSSPVPSPDREPADAAKIEGPPSKAKLEEMIQHELIESDIKRRGGPGRLSFAEVEAAVKADESKELRGLVISWLAWASF